MRLPEVRLPGHGRELPEQPVDQYALPGANAPQRDLDSVARNAGIFGKIDLQTVDLELLILVDILGGTCIHGRLI